MVFSVDTMEEANRLIVTCCPMDNEGNYYARELAEEQTLENLQAFSDRLNSVHERMVEGGNCTCGGGTAGVL